MALFRAAAVLDELTAVCHRDRPTGCSTSHKLQSMSSRIHPQARTIPKIRQEIKDSGLSDREAANVFNITRETAARWPKRDDVQDRSHRGHTLHTTLSTTQEANRNYSSSAFMIKRDWTLSVLLNK